MASLLTVHFRVAASLAEQTAAAGLGSHRSSGGQQKAAEAPSGRRRHNYCWYRLTQNYDPSTTSSALFEQLAVVEGLIS